eukprot:CAMPEP_0177684258 /NCGR_PEP_ID=MMETSP0447-20121125/32324_1 /TAXON_ID=0 /ORGANISM="Stygamoeba regulata, Strain BSH-02190019" /LENGTH=35 /DNA_ID= /DNA_START= /DNA_END= /DNA_ORIENTATION=
MVFSSDGSIGRFVVALAGGDTGDTDEEDTRGTEEA